MVSWIIITIRWNYDDCIVLENKLILSGKRRKEWFNGRRLSGLIIMIKKRKTNRPCQ